MVMRASETKMHQNVRLPLPGMDGVQDDERFLALGIEGAILGDCATYEGMGMG